MIVCVRSIFFTCRRMSRSLAPAHPIRSTAFVCTGAPTKSLAPPL
jgi:hypothetical protein